MTEDLDIQNGDTVRLRNGETIVVRDTFDSYRDVDGEHEGPFLHAMGENLDRYLVADVIEVVDANPNRCDICGNGVTSKNPEKYPYCQSCHYTGQASQAIYADVHQPIRDAFPDAEVSVWHTGGGCFMLSVKFDGDEGYYGLTEGEASLPADPKTGEPIPDGWGLVMRYENDESDEGRVLLVAYDDDAGADGIGSDRYWDEYPTHAYATEQVVAAIRADREGVTA